MDHRTKTLLLCFVFAVFLTASGCGFSQQQSRFQMSFLPPAPNPAGAAIDMEPPSVPQPNVFIRPTPAFLNADPRISEGKSRGDALARQAQQHFERGRRRYQSNNVADARAEFDTAVDLMLDAFEENPAGRLTYDRELDRMVDAIHRFDLAGMGASAAVEEGKFEKAPLEDILQMTFPVDPKMKDRVREQVSASVSQLPLTVNDAVLGYVQFFSNRGRRTLLYGLQRAGRYRPMIQRVLDEEGVPQELIHLAQAESGFMPRAMSRAAAGGMWQFLSDRGRQYGLNRTGYIDERMDPEKATRAAARHLRDLFDEFGDWYLAIAAYNCGPGNVEKAVERTGYADFWELRRRGTLPAETTNYVPIIVAMAIMQKNAAEYGIDEVQPDPPLEYDTVEIAAPTSLALISDVTDTPLPELLDLNPALLKNVAPAGYELHAPKGAGNQLMTALQLIPEDRRDSWRMHRVSAGETVASIARQYGTDAESVVAANKLESSDAQEGDRLLIPAAARPEASVRRAATSSSSRTKARRASSRTASKASSARTKTASSTKTARTKTASSAKTASSKSATATASKTKTAVAAKAGTSKKSKSSSGASAATARKSSTRLTRVAVR
jgi:membrane-bound lytic murein transglycosylase D